jgi:hypothetical protein
VLTGFLGAGKSTLLNRLLKDPALADTVVIINEFGEVGLDHLLVEAADGDMLLLSSGCLCCTIRGDLITTLEDLLRRRDNDRMPAFKRVVIETTGLADPAPVLHTIMYHPYLLMRFRLDGVVTLVDAVNGASTLDAHEEAVKQAAVADRIVLMREGRIEQQGAPLELFEHPATQYVAGFLGSPSMNFIPAQLHSDASGLCLHLGSGLNLALPSLRFGHLQDRVGSSVLLGVRPEHIQRNGGERQGMASIQVDIELVQPTGSRTFVEFKLGNSTTVAELQAHDVQRSGERISLAIDMNRVILIDPTSEQVITNGRQH